MRDSLELIKELSDASGVSGYENEIREILRRRLEGVADVERDGLGSLVALLRGGIDRPRVMIAAHMDEVGFMVSAISKEGFLYFKELGGWSPLVLLAQQVVVESRSGKIPGVIGSKPPHLLGREERKKPVKSSEMFVDVGAVDGDEVAVAGDTPGIKETEAKAKLGAGPCVYIYDRTLIPNPELRDFIADISERRGIPVQYQASSGGTDGGHISLHGTGVPSIVVGVPTRYIHSHLGIANAGDFERTVELLISVIESLDEKAVAVIRG